MKKFELKNKDQNTDYQYEWNKNFEDSLKTLMLYSWWILWWILTIFIANYEKFQLIKINNDILLVVVICLLLSFVFGLLWKFLLTFLAYSLHDFWIIKENIDRIKKHENYLSKLVKNVKQLDTITEEALNLKKITKDFIKKIKQWISTRSWVSICFAISLIGFILWIIWLTYLFFEIIK